MQRKHYYVNDGNFNYHTRYKAILLYMFNSHTHTRMLQKTLQNLFRKDLTKKYVVTRNNHIVIPREPRMRTTLGRFTTDVENLHGRIAMVGLCGCALDESLTHIPVVQQFVTETGMPSINLFAFVTFVTSVFILEAFNPITIRKEEPELDIFNNPGFTLETEILHGRMAMLAFAYVVLAEQLYAKLVL